MTTNNKITSGQNPKIKSLLRLYKKSQRDKTHRFLIEGYRELLRAIEEKYPIEALFISREHFLGASEEKLLKIVRKRGGQIFECSKSVFEKISYRDRPDGLIASAKSFHYSLKDLDQVLKKKKNYFLLVAQKIEKPGNLGTILRSCDAAGVDAVIICDQCTDVFNPNVVRSSIGTLFTQMIVETTSEECLKYLSKKKIPILSTSPSASKIFTQVDLKKSTAVVVGSEQYGLTDEWVNSADLLVKIPMYGKADSLNVASATTLVLYEVARQRHVT